MTSLFCDVFGPCCIHILVKLHLGSGTKLIILCFSKLLFRPGMVMFKYYSNNCTRFHFNPCKPAKCEQTLKLISVVTYLQFLHFKPNSIPFPHTIHVCDIQYFVENLQKAFLIGYCVTCYHTFIISSFCLNARGRTGSFCFAVKPSDGFDLLTTTSKLSG